jgi:hypothetical protein
MKKSTVIIMWGVITGVVDCVFYQFLNMSDNMNSSLRYISWVLIFAGLLVGTLQYRKANDGYASFGEGYKAGILMTLIISVIATLGFVIFLQMHPDFMQKMMDQQRIAMVNRGMTSDQIDKAMGYAKMFTSPGVMIVFSILGCILTGAIMSLLSSGIAARNKPLIEDDNTPIQ